MIHEPMIAALNDADAEEMRKGYILGVINQRGAHFVDPTGNEERAIADEYKKASDDALTMGYQRYSNALRKIAVNYEREARQTVKEEAEWKQQEEE